MEIYTVHRLWFSSFTVKNIQLHKHKLFGGRRRKHRIETRHQFQSSFSSRVFVKQLCYPFPKDALWIQFGWNLPNEFWRRRCIWKCENLTISMTTAKTTMMDNGQMSICRTVAFRKNYCWQTNVYLKNSQFSAHLGSGELKNILLTI